MSPASGTRRVVRQRAKGPVGLELGQRVRALRIARGISQAELAGSDYSKSLIGLIETGRTRMSLQTAEKLASRLGVPVADLLAAPPAPKEKEFELALLRAESEFRAGKPDDAVRLTEGLDRKTSGLLRARVQRLRGRALNASSHSREAIRLLDEALRTFREKAEHELVARTLYDLAVAHGRLDQIGESLNLALEAERALRDRQVVDRTFELTVLSLISALFVVLGDFGAADIRAERARVVAEDVTDPRALATLYGSLAQTREQQGDYEGALVYARRTLEIEERLGEKGEIGSSWNTIGWVLVRRGNFSHAVAALNQAQGIADEIKDGRLLAYVQQTRADLALAQGQLNDAIALADISIANPSASGRCRAGSLLVRAQALAKTTAPLDAVNAAFAEALGALEPYGRRQLARAYQDYFNALLERGEAQAANRAAARALELGTPSLA